MRANQKILPVSLLLVILTIFLFSGLTQVPFHPDESTQLYMSRDFELLLSNPSALAWDPEKEADPKQRYRELDAPLTRYILGSSRVMTGMPPLKSDWDWSKSWDENAAAGALPDERLLATGRFATTLLIPISLLFLYKTGESLGGQRLGGILIFLLGTSALVLIHGRRAMAESALTFGVTLALWGFLRGDRAPLFAGLGAAMAFNAKQSALALLPVGLLAVVWIQDGDNKARNKLGNIAQYLLAFIGLTLILNPLWWHNPLPALQASWQARQDLLARQVALTQELVPEQLLTTPAERAAIVLANLFITEPQIAEVGNYLKDTQLAASTYLSFPGHSLFRGFAGGGLLLGMNLYGLIVAFRLARSGPAFRSRQLVLLLSANFLQATALILSVPLPHQRYIIPLVPYTCIWTGFAIENLYQALLARKRLKRPSQPTTLIDKE